MGAAGDADPLGPVEDEYVATGRFNRVSLAAMLGGLVLVGLGFVLPDYSIELWVFGGFAVLVGLITRSRHWWRGSSRTSGPWTADLPGPGGGADGGRANRHLADPGLGVVPRRRTVARGRSPACEEQTNGGNQRC